MRLAVIPARGGSKRILRKNIKPFCGKPIIAWSIEAALLSGCFDEVIVSTDDQEIVEVAKQYGASAPFIRPASLANDFVGTTPVVRHAIEWFQKCGRTPIQVCCIYATAPFIQVDNLRLGLELLRTSDCDYAFSVTSYPFPIQRAIKITQQGRVEMFQSELFNTRSQDLQEAWHDAGQFYWGRAQAWLEDRVVFTSTSVPIKLPRHRVQDIDTPEDWERAEWLFKALQSDPNSDEKLLG
jgi:pseudaminic acid cytidylyltransferase